MASDVGFSCAVCGHSDVGIVRLLGFGFKVGPCPSCIEHFRPLLPAEPEPEDEPAPVVESSHPPEETTDTPSSFEPGTLW